MAKPTKTTPMDGKGKIFDTLHSTAKRAAGQPKYKGAPYGIKKQ